uniref:Uncharacterized protein n=1 Tax=Arundo donax TaxID=35708 RepID=A0A0A9GP23_ARUDO
MMPHLSMDRRRFRVQSSSFGTHPPKTPEVACRVGRRKAMPIAMTRPQEPPLSGCRCRREQATNMHSPSRCQSSRAIDQPNVTSPCRMLPKSHQNPTR